MGPSRFRQFRARSLGDVCIVLGGALGLILAVFYIVLVGLNWTPYYTGMNAPGFAIAGYLSSLSEDELSELKKKLICPLPLPQHGDFSGPYSQIAHKSYLDCLRMTYTGHGDCNRF